MKTMRNFLILQVLSATIKNRPKRREASGRNSATDEVIIGYEREKNGHNQE
jgi:hypothetical protein